MNKLIPCLSMIIGIIMLISCTSGNNKTVLNSKGSVKIQTFKYIDLQQKSENKLNVSEFADTVIYIPLETNPKSFLRKIVQIQLTDKYIFVNGFDRLLLFSKEGKFIRQISKKGKGPGEHLNIFGFVVVQDTIYITSSGKRSMIIYNINGKFLKEQPTTSQLAYFNVTPENRIVSYQKDSGTLVFFDQKLNGADTITVEYNVSDKREMYGWWDYSDSFFYKSDRQLLFTNYMSDTIWNISNERKDIAYILNLGDKLLPSKYQVEYCQGDFNRFETTAAPYQKIYLAETPSYLFLFQKGWIEKNKINTTYIHDVHANTTRKFESPYIFDDLVSKQNLIPIYFSNNYIVSTMSPIDFIEQLKTENKQKQTEVGSPSPLWLRQMATITENDNPILVIIPVRNKGLKTEL